MISVPLIKPDLPDFAILEDGFRELLASGKITNFGKYVSAFEEEASAFLSAEVVTVSSGTAGLILALQASGLRPGDKVILPSFTFMATAQAVLYAGGIPVFAEINPDLTLSPEDLETLLSRHEDVTTILAVHTFGQPARVAEIQSLVTRQSRSKLISVIYDAAHAFGSAHGGRNVGVFGDAEIFSLSATKVLVGVEGGLVSSNNSALIERIRHTRNYGVDTNYNARWPGMNGKMSEFHALIALHNLRRFPALMAERQRNARYYIDSIQAQTDYQIPGWPIANDVTHTFKDFTILMPPERVHERDAIMGFLKQRGIETRAYFDPPLHQQNFFHRFADRSLPRTEAAARRIMSLPFYTTITEREIDYVVSCLAEA